MDSLASHLVIHSMYLELLFLFLNLKLKQIGAIISFTSTVWTTEFATAGTEPIFSRSVWAHRAFESYHADGFSEGLYSGVSEKGILGPLYCPHFQ